MHKAILVAFLVLALTTDVAFAAKSGSSSSGKSVSVRSYTRKDGTVVSAHTRSSPGSGSSSGSKRSSSAAFTPPPVTYRTSARTQASTEPRTEARMGVATREQRERDSDDELQLELERERQKSARLEEEIRNRDKADSARLTDETNRTRTWTSEDGKFSVVAAFLHQTGDSVKLRRTDDGREITVRIDTLCEDDRQWIKERSTKISSKRTTP